MKPRAPRAATLAIVAVLLAPAPVIAAQRPQQNAGVVPDFDIRLLTPRVPAALDAEALKQLEELRGSRTDLASRPHPHVSGLRVLRGYGRPLWPGERGTPEQVARRFVARYHHLLGLESSDLGGLLKTREYRSRGEQVVHLTFQQSPGGIPVFGTELRFHFTPAGDLLSVGTTAVPVGVLPQGVMNASDAARIAASHVRSGLTFSPSVLSGPVGADQRTRFDRGPFRSNVESRLTWFPTGDGARLAWASTIEPIGFPQKYDVLVDAVTGELLYRRNRILYADGSGRVLQSAATFALDPRRPDQRPSGASPSQPNDAPGGCPPVSNHVVRSLAAPFRDPSTVLDTSGHLSGNNVHVFRGMTGTEGAVGTSQPDGWHFDFSFNSAAAAETHLFFIGNFLHDFFYDLGFDEAAGNFQVNNFGRGGIGGDSLAMIARAGGRNNATFEPQPDGTTATLSMFLWDGQGCWAEDVDGDSASDLDGDLDGDIVIHEFHHGVSQRLNTAFTGIEADAIGEGGSDFFAYSINGDTKLAEYASPPSGIRAVNGKTYDDWFCLSFFGLVFCEPHDNGEIWANVMWDLRERFRGDAVGGSDAAAIRESHQLYIDGLKLSPPSPTMLDLRDAILDADAIRHPSGGPGGSVNHCRIWEVFAIRGLGAAAHDTDDTGTASVNADFVVPAECPALPPPPTVTVTASPTRATESPLAPAAFHITRAGDTSRALTIYFHTGGSALAGSDYVALPSNVTIQAGVSVAELTLTPIDDTLVENDETVVLTLDGAVGYQLGSPASATATIASEDVAPDLFVSAYTAPSNGAAGGQISVASTTKNQGTGSATPSITRYVLSTNFTIDASDVVLGDVAVPALAPGADSPSTVTLTIPSGMATGSYYLGVQADATATNAETTENNNTRFLQIRIGPDLTVSSISGPSIVSAGTTIAVTETTKNGGAGAAGASQTRFYVSTNASYDTSDVAVGGRPVPALSSGATSTATTSVTLPSTLTTGTYYLLARADGDQTVVETLETNNVSFIAVRVGPDLTVSTASVSGTVQPGASFTVSETTRNAGGAAADASATRIYLSANTLVDASDTSLGVRSVPALAAGAMSSGSTIVTMPASVAPGSYYLLLVADGDAHVAESSESNNVYAITIRIGADLVIAGVAKPASIAAGSSFSLTDTTRNQGSVASNPSVTSFRLSNNFTLDASDPLLGSRSVGALAANTSSSGTTMLIIPASTPPGTYYIVTQVDTENTTVESNELNNLLFSAIQVTAAP
jgi:subtilase family serine protease